MHEKFWSRSIFHGQANRSHQFGPVAVYAACNDCTVSTIAPNAQEFPLAVLHELEYSILLISHSRILSYVEREIPPRPMLTTGVPLIVVWTD